MAREHTRFRKYKQVLEDKLASAELSLRYWAQQENFWAWVSVPVSERVTPELLRGREQALIQTLQPPLNFPFIARWICPRKVSSSLQMPPLPRKTGIFRLWRKTAEAGAETCRRRVSRTTISAVRHFRETGIQNKRGHVGPPYSAGEQHIAAF